MLAAEAYDAIDMAIVLVDRVLAGEDLETQVDGVTLKDQLLCWKTEPAVVERLKEMQ